MSKARVWGHDEGQDQILLLVILGSQRTGELRQVGVPLYLLPAFNPGSLLVPYEPFTPSSWSPECNLHQSRDPYFAHWCILGPRLMPATPPALYTYWMSYWVLEHITNFPDSLALKGYFLAKKLLILSNVLKPNPFKLKFPSVKSFWNAPSESLWYLCAVCVRACVCVRTLVCGENT